jgi:hypothetical protein
LYSLLTAAVSCPAGEYEYFDVAIYIPVGVVERFEDRERHAGQTFTTSACDVISSLGISSFVIERKQACLT